MSCPKRIDVAVLTDYWLGALEESAENSVEEHLFRCDECGARLDEVIALAEQLRQLSRQGSLTVIVSDSFLSRLAAHGATVREYAPPPSGSVECTVTADDDFLIGRLTAELGEAGQVDLSFCDGDGVERVRLPDIPFSPAAGGVAFQQSITYAKAAPSERLVARLVGVDKAGNERLIGEYTFNHTRSLPGPGAW